MHSTQLLKSQGQKLQPREVAANIIKHLNAPPAVIEKVALNVVA